MVAEGAGESVDSPKSNGHRYTCEIRLIIAYSLLDLWKTYPII